MKACLFLECEGRQDDGFRYCSGVKNVILDLEHIKHTENYTTLIKYLDGVAKLFDKPCAITHIVTNAIYKIYELGYIPDKKYKLICNFYNIHKPCGIILSILPKQ